MVKLRKAVIAGAIQTERDLMGACFDLRQVQSIWRIDDIASVHSVDKDLDQAAAVAGRADRESGLCGLNLELIQKIASLKW